jgi:hypothetical protein
MVLTAIPSAGVCLTSTGASRAPTTIKPEAGLLGRRVQGGRPSSLHVARQYSGTLAKIRNCQIVYGHTATDAASYPLDCWLQVPVARAHTCAGDARAIALKWTGFGSKAAAVKPGDCIARRAPSGAEVAPAIVLPKK